MAQQHAHVTSEIAHTRRAFLALIPTLGLSIATVGLPSLVSAQSDPWQVLRDGGAIIFRHARAPGTGDPENFDLADCSTQRNLNDVGRVQSARIGEAFAAQGIEVGAVLYSRWCRSADTARLAFPDLARPEPALDSFFRDRSREPAQTAAVRQLVAEWQGPGALVMVTHFVNVQALTGQRTDEGEGIVMRPTGTGSGFELAGRIAI